MKNTLTLLRNSPVVSTGIPAITSSITGLPLDICQALVGQLLADAHADRSSSTSNTRITWSFGAKYEQYARFVESIFSSYIGKGLYPVNVRAKQDGQLLGNYRLKTLTSSLFNEFHNMFYVVDQSTGKYTKVVPTMINDLMSPITLAHLIMGDGNYDKGRNRVRIFTNSFSHEDCVRLAAAITNMGILTNVMRDREGTDGRVQYVLTIGAKQLDNLRTVVSPFMDKSMLYRIGSGV